MIEDIDNINKSHRFDWSSLFIISLASIVMGIYRDGVAALFPFLQREFELTRGEIGLYITFLYLTSSLFSIYGGRLVDLKGSKWGMISGILYVGILLILHSFVPNFIVLLMLAALAGLGMSINPSAANKAITEWSSTQRRSTATGIWSSSFHLGGLLAASLLPFLGTLLGWRKAIISPGVLSMLCALFIYIVYQEKNQAKDHSADKEVGKVSFWIAVKKLVSNVDLLAISVYGFFLGSVNGSIVSHFTLFLFLDCGLSESIAGMGFAIAHFGSILGRPGWGFICDRLLGGNKRKGFLMMSILFLIITLVFGLFFKRISPYLPVIFFLAFLIGGSGRAWDGLYFSSIPEMVAEDEVGAAIGFSMLFTRAGMLIAPPIIGFIADSRGSYDVSWLILGLVTIFVSVAQYLFYMRSKHK